LFDSHDSNVVAVGTSGSAAHGQASGTTLTLICQGEGMPAVAVTGVP
jgi:hypothetical protein